MLQTIKFTVDKVKVYGPKIDGGWTVTFNIGEYEKQPLSQLMLLDSNKMIDITVEQKDDKR